MIWALFFISLAYGAFAGIFGHARGWSQAKTAVVAGISYAAVLVVAMLLARAALAEDPKTTELLKQTAVFISGTECGGSGSVVRGSSGSLYILTNAHVCNCARYMGGVYAIFEDGTTLRAPITKMDWASDLCAAKVEGGFPSLKLAPRLLPLTPVITRGYPGGHLSQSHGVVQGATVWETHFPIDAVGTCPRGSMPEIGLSGRLESCRMRFRSTRSTLYARPGSSGSPVINYNGELVGVISSFHPGDATDAGQTTYDQTKAFLGGL